MTTLCKDCFTGYQIPGTPRGSISTLDGLECYTTRPSSGQPRSNKALLLLTDVFGLALTNAKLQADHYADALQINVFVPDMFEGDTAPVEGLYMIEKPVGQKPLLSQIKEIGLMASSMMLKLGPLWVYRHRAAVVGPKVEKFARFIKETEASDGLLLLGYCFGGIRTVILSQDPHLVKAAAIAHPGSLTDAELKGVKVPATWVCAEEDFAMTEKKRLEIQEYYTQQDVEAEFKVYPGVTHGFAARPNLADPESKSAFEGAFQQVSSFFLKHL